MKPGIGAISTTIVALGIGCTIRFDWPEHQIDVVIAGGNDQTLETVTDAGMEVEATDLDVGVQSVELVTCDAINGEHRALPGFAELLTPDALAHGISTSTLSAVPVLVRALPERGGVLATLTPPPGEYCALRIEIGPLDGDARDLGDETTMIGASIEAGGRYRAGDVTDWTSFHWSTAARATISRAFAEPLVLGEKSRHLRFEVTPNVVHWFTSLDMSANDDDAARQLLTNAVDAVELAR